MKFSKDTFRIAGAEFKTRNVLISLAVAFGCMALVIILEMIGVLTNLYGVLIGVAFVLALVFARKYCAYRDLNDELPYDLILWIFPLSIIGARLYYCIFEGSFDMFFDIAKGGLAIYGGIIGGAIGLVLCCIIKKINPIKAMDVVAPVLILGQAIGRIGCYSAGCCYGADVINKGMQWFPIAYHVHGGWHYATFFWEFTLCVIGFFVLAWILRRFKNTGLVTFSYLFYYGVVRYFTESFRDQSAQLFIGDQPVSLWLSLILVVLGTIGILTIVIKERIKDKN
ncbi:MAG: prolipoprotein diacylglyceryl transferase [Clostridiales bacterium]|nr:prolipoprotein diacylglyceryl transferase [Clostridiales bacterium]